MSIRNEIALLATGLSDGDNAYMECPSCGREGKFSICRTDTGAVLYHCFRPSCELHRGGAVSDGGSLVGARRSLPRKSYTPYEKPLVPLDEEQAEFLHRTVGWDADHVAACGVRYAPEDDRYAFAIRGPKGDRRGWVLRSWKKSDAALKALTYMDGEFSKFSIYRPQTCTYKTVIAVEDIPSAVRASRYLPAVALLGTSCNTTAAAELARDYDRIIWALDADATTQAFRLQADHRLWFPKSEVMILERDLKDETEDRLKEILNERT